MKKKYMNWFFAVAVAFSGVCTVSCEDEPDKYEVTGGKPTIKYIRPAANTTRDSLLTGQYMGNTICMVGENLRSIVELYFNDQKAVLNTSYITDNTMMVDIPGNIPSIVTNKIYMVTNGRDTVNYDFKVLVPAPSVNTISNEWAQAGEKVTISGDYFLDDENVPLTVTMPEGTVLTTDDFEFTKTSISFNIPASSTENGYISVTSIYGESRSKFMFHDSRNILFDFDNDSDDALASGHGWRNGMIKNDIVSALDGDYLYLGGTEVKGEIGGTWAEDNFCVNYWPDKANGYPEINAMPEMIGYIEQYGTLGLQLKFEVNVPAENPWMSAALQVMLTTDSEVTYATASNGYYGNTTLPRALWMPWQSSGSYDTDGQWRTVIIPLSNFTYTNDGQPCATGFDISTVTGLTLFVWHGGVEGTDCNPVICIDNIRIVPVE